MMIGLLTSVSIFFCNFETKIQQLLKRKVDFLIIGSGIAGLSYALKVAQHGKVCMITKANEDESSAKYAQGGIAAVMYSPDSYEKHIKDTLIAGDGLCDEKIVR